MAHSPSAHTHREAVGPVVANETGWLIERKGWSPPMWWHPVCVWTTDASAALRFARKADADALIDFHCLQPVAFSSEHLWSAASDQSQEGGK